MPNLMNFVAPKGLSPHSQQLSDPTSSRKPRRGQPVKSGVHEFGKFASQNANKLTNPSVARGKTAIPKASKDLEKYGLRLDYDGMFTAPDGREYNKFQVQINAGKIPPGIKKLRDSDPRGTHGVLGSIYVLNEGSIYDVAEAYRQFLEAYRDNRPTPRPGDSAESSAKSSSASSDTGPRSNGDTRKVKGARPGKSRKE